MDCSICFETIADSTWSARLSCGHLYHFGCLARWVLKNQTCPYCRHQTNAYETIHEDSDSEEESEYIDDAESQSIDEEPNLRWIRIGPGHWRIFDDAVTQLPDFNEEDHAFWVFRNLFGSLEEDEPLPQPTPLSQKQEYDETQQHLLFRHRHIYDSSTDKGYESA